MSHTKETCPPYEATPLYIPTSDEVLADCCRQAKGGYIIEYVEATRIYVKFNGTLPVGLKDKKCKVSVEYHYGYWQNNAPPGDPPAYTFTSLAIREGLNVMFDCLLNREFTIIQVIKIGDCPGTPSTSSGTAPANGCYICGYTGATIAQNGSYSSPDGCCYHIFDLCNCQVDCPSVTPGTICIGGKCVVDTPLTCTLPPRTGTVTAACPDGFNVPCDQSPQVTWSVPAVSLTQTWSSLYAENRYKASTQELAQAFLCEKATQQQNLAVAAAIQSAQATADALCTPDYLVTVINDPSKGTVTVTPAGYLVGNPNPISATTTVYTFRACPTNNVCVTVTPVTNPVPYSSRITSDLGTGSGDNDGNIGPNSNCGVVDSNKTVTVTYEEATVRLQITNNCPNAAYTVSGGSPGAILSSNYVSGVFIVRENANINLTLQVEATYAIPAITGDATSSGGSVSFNVGTANRNLVIGPCPSTNRTLTIIDECDNGSVQLTPPSPFPVSIVGNTRVYTYLFNTDVTVSYNLGVGYEGGFVGYPATQDTVQLQLDVNRTLTLACSPIPVRTLVIANNCIGSTVTVTGSTPIGTPVVSGNITTYQFYNNSPVTVNIVPAPNRQLPVLEEGGTPVTTGFVLTTDRTLSVECAPYPRFYIRENQHPGCGQYLLSVNPSQPLVGIPSSGGYTGFELQPGTVVTINHNITGCCRLGLYSGPDAGLVVSNQLTMGTTDVYVETNYIPDTFDLVIDTNGCGVTVQVETLDGVIPPVTSISGVNTYQICKNRSVTVYANGTAANIHPVITGDAVGIHNSNPSVTTNQATLTMNGPKNLEINQAGCLTASARELTVFNACTGTSLQFQVTGGVMSTLSGGAVTAQPSGTTITYLVTDGANVNIRPVGLAGCSAYTVSVDSAAPVAFNPDTNVITSGGDRYVVINCPTCKPPRVLTVNNNCPGSTFTVTPDRYGNTTGLSTYYYDDLTPVTFSITTPSGYTTATVSGDYIGVSPGSLLMDGNKALTINCEPFPTVRVRSLGTCCVNWLANFAPSQTFSGTGNSGATPLAGGWFEFAGVIPGTQITFVSNPDPLCSFGDITVTGAGSISGNVLTVGSSGIVEVTINCTRDKRLFTVDKSCIGCNASQVLTGGIPATIVSGSGGAGITTYAVRIGQDVVLQENCTVPNLHPILVSGTVSGVNNANPTATTNQLTIASYNTEVTATVSCTSASTDIITVTNNCSNAVINVSAIGGFIQSIPATVGLTISPSTPQTVQYTVTDGASVIFNLSAPNYPSGTCGTFEVTQATTATTTNIGSSYNSGPITVPDTFTFDCIACEQPAVVTINNSCAQCGGGFVTVNVVETGPDPLGKFQVVQTGSNTWNVTKGAQIQVTVTPFINCPVGSIFINGNPGPSAVFTINGDQTLMINCPNCPCNGPLRTLEVIDNCQSGTLTVTASVGSVTQINPNLYQVANNSIISYTYLPALGHTAPIISPASPIGPITSNQTLTINSCPCVALNNIVQINQCNLAAVNVQLQPLSTGGDPYNCGLCTTCTVNPLNPLQPGVYNVLLSGVPSGIHATYSVQNDSTGAFINNGLVTVAPGQVLPDIIQINCSLTEIPNIAQVTFNGCGTGVTLTLSNGSDVYTLTAGGSYGIKPGNYTAVATGPGGFNYTVNPATFVVSVGQSTPVNIQVSCQQQLGTLVLIPDPDCDGVGDTPAVITVPGVGNFTMNQTHTVTLPAGTYNLTTSIGTVSDTPTGPTNLTAVITQSSSTIKYVKCDPSLTQVYINWQNPCAAGAVINVNGTNYSYSGSPGAVLAVTLPQGTILSYNVISGNVTSITGTVASGSAIPAGTSSVTLTPVCSIPTGVISASCDSDCGAGASVLATPTGGGTPITIQCNQPAIQIPLGQYTLSIVGGTGTITPSVINVVTASIFALNVDCAAPTGSVTFNCTGCLSGTQLSLTPTGGGSPITVNCNTTESNLAIGTYNIAFTSGTGTITPNPVVVTAGGNLSVNATCAASNATVNVSCTSCGGSPAPVLTFTPTGGGTPVTMPCGSPASYTLPAGMYTVTSNRAMMNVPSGVVTLLANQTYGYTTTCQDAVVNIVKDNTCTGCGGGILIEEINGIGNVVSVLYTGSYTAFTSGTFYIVSGNRIRITDTLAGGCTLQVVN
jgi:hypothetical protein